MELAAGAHGDYTVSLGYGGRTLAEQPWGVGRPWGVTVFWILLCLVVPAAVFRLGMAVVDRVRPGAPAGRALHRRSLRLIGPALRVRRPGAPSSSSAPPFASTLPWFTPDADPGTAVHGRLSAPHENGPSTPRKGNT